MKIDIFKLLFSDLHLEPRKIPKIRGYIANRFKEYDVLHNHNDNKYLYRYPLIQYKIVNEAPALIGTGDGIRVLETIENEIRAMNLDGEKIELYEKQMYFNVEQFGCLDELMRYNFISPWMCLNEKNYKIYLNSSAEEKKKLLNKILIGNILSMSKGLGYTVDKELKTYVEVTPCEINFKNKTMLGFKGHFIINFKIPDYLGIGKSVSRGFGTVKSCYPQ